ncbi:hypothetical protein BGZ60DRAFT_391025 [Tricladium varicosporioides]|nr:hypothetical protein BGZ60DRAFT_391025 [Hymenoscyphus varicosporioides]
MKASQACATCKKQKRRCTKTLPACQLCERMNRHCDYSDAAPNPTPDEFNNLRIKIAELESRMNGGTPMMGQPSPYATPSSTTMSIPESAGPMLMAYNQAQEPPTMWNSVPNKFPAIAFLDTELFVNGGYVYESVPKPPVPIPSDILALLGDSASVQEVMSAYFSTIHPWMPIFSQRRLNRDMINPSWEAGPDLALLFICMKLIISSPPDGISAQTPIYTSAKRFSSSLEAAGMVTLIMLQANLLITWYEYGQAIYPAACMTAGWCVRYGNLLGINGDHRALALIGRPGTWVEQEERRRTWWGVQIADRVVSMSAQGYVKNSQEPQDGTDLPVDDGSWEEGEMALAQTARLSNTYEDPVGPFPRLCQASVMMGKVLIHNFDETEAPESEKFNTATRLYLEGSQLAKRLTDEFEVSGHHVSLAAPLALAFIALCALCDPYSCPQQFGNDRPSDEAQQMVKQAIDGLTTVSSSVHDFAKKLEGGPGQIEDLNRVSPIMMGCLYAAATNFAWFVREKGAREYQNALEDLRVALRKYSARWRNAAEYVRLLDGQEFSYAVNKM